MSNCRNASEDLVWQEKWIAGVREGIEDADRGDFASEEEILAVLNRYRQGSD